MEVTGRIKMIGEPQNVSSSFRKREVVVTTDEQYPQHILVEFTQDRTDLLNGFQVGQPVKISINLRGREWVSPQGETRYFNTIQGWRIENLVQQPAAGGDPYQQGYNQAPPQGYNQAPQGGYNQAPQQGYNQAPQGGGFNQNANAFPPAPNFNEEEPDDLPF